MHFSSGIRHFARVAGEMLARPTPLHGFPQSLPTDNAGGGEGDEESGSYFFTRMVLQPLFLQSFW